MKLTFYHVKRASAALLGVAFALALFIFFNSTVRGDRCPVIQPISSGEMPPEIRDLAVNVSNWHMLERCGQGVTIGILLTAPLPDVGEIPNLEFLNTEATTIDLTQILPEQLPKYDEALARNSTTIDLVRFLAPSAQIKVYALPEALGTDDFKSAAENLVENERVDIILNGVTEVSFNTLKNRTDLEAFITASTDVLWLHTIGRYEKTNYVEAKPQDAYYLLENVQVTAEFNLTPVPEVFVIAIPEEDDGVSAIDKLSLTITGLNGTITTCQIDIQGEILHVWPDDNLRYCTPSDTQFMAASTSLKFELQLLTVGTYNLQIFGNDLAFNASSSTFIPSPNNLEADHSMSVARQGTTEDADLAVISPLKTQLYPLAYAGGIAGLYYQEIQPLFPPSEQPQAIVKLAQMLRSSNKLGKLEVQAIQSSQYVAVVLGLCLVVMIFTIVIWRQIKKTRADRYAHAFGLGVGLCTLGYITQTLYSQVTAEPVLIGITIFVSLALLIGFLVLSGILPLDRAARITLEIVTEVATKLGLPITKGALENLFNSSNDTNVLPNNQAVESPSEVRLPEIPSNIQPTLDREDETSP